MYIQDDSSVRKGQLGCSLTTHVTASADFYTRPGGIRVGVCLCIYMERDSQTGACVRACTEARECVAAVWCVASGCASPATPLSPCLSLWMWWRGLRMCLFPLHALSTSRAGQPLLRSEHPLTLLRHSSTDILPRFFLGSVFCERRKAREF